jgi:heavy metal sensor kinase
VTFTLRSRLTLLYTALFVVLLAVIAAVSYRVLQYQLDADVSASLTELTTGLHGYIRFPNGLPLVVFDQTDAAQAAFVEEATRYYQIFDARTGELIVQSDALRPLGLEFTPAEVRQFHERPITLDLDTDYGRMRFSNSVLTPAAGRPYLLQVGASLAPMDSVLKRFLILLVMSVPAGLVVTFVIGRWLAAVALRPLIDLADVARTIDIGDLRRRLPNRGVRDEPDVVATAFNDTLARLEHAVGEMRQFSTALAHELRTPLAALRGEAEMAMRHPGSAEEIQRRFASQLEEIDKLKRLIDQVLTLARAEAGEIRLTSEPIDLDELAGALVDSLEPVAQEKGVALRFEPAGARVVVEGDPGWLERLVLNLVDNAIKFTPTAGVISVRVSRDGEIARLAVRDTGIGITPELMPHIFERFFRADPARSSGVEGVGLGLSLAQWIVDRHRGRISIESQPGRGSTFTVILPIAAH